MKKFLVLLAAIALFCGGCAHVTDIRPDLSKQHGAMVVLAEPTPVTSTKLADSDFAIFSKIHDVALTNCLYVKNRQDLIVAIGGIGLTDNEVALATIGTAVVAVKTQAKPWLIAGGLATLLSTELKSLVGLPPPSKDFTPVVNGMQYIYNMYTTSPGIASMMNDTTPKQPQRVLAIKEYEIALQEVCLTRFTIPTTPPTTPQK